MHGSKERDTKQASISTGTTRQLHLPLWPRTQQWSRSARGSSEASWVNPSPSQPSPVCLRTLPSLAGTSAGLARAQ